VVKVLPWLEKGAKGSMDQRPQCFTCHNQGLPVLALTTARKHGFLVDAAQIEQQVGFTAKFLAKNRENYLKGRGQGGQAMTAGYALWTLDAGGWPRDETTAAVAEYLLQFQQDQDHWRSTSNRPPSESSHFAATYLAVRGLRQFGTPEQSERIDARIGAARRWLVSTAASDTEDRVFRLWALSLAGAEEKDLQAAADELRKTQRKDGGWAQTGALESDAYAAGSALAALHIAGGMPPGDAAYQRGLRFLVASQLDDGSWRVQSRSKPFQTYFESGFPHGTDQFISITASSWAAMALSLACPKG
jgi:hypothetical protein